MQAWLLALLGCCGLYIAFEDFKTRLISVWAIVLYVVLAFWIYFSGHGFTEYLWNMAFCICYFVVCFGIIKLAFFVKTGRFERITNSKIGLGDIILIFALGGLLQPEVLVFFFTFVFVISLLLQLLFFKKNPALPLAGFLTIIYSAYITTVNLDWLNLNVL